MGVRAPGLEARFAQYRNTIVEVTLPDGNVIAVAPGAPAPQALESLLPLFVVTAWNPGAERPGPAVNAEANLHLRARLEELGAVSILPARGLDADPHSDYYEDGFAVSDLPRAQVLAVAREFDQDAIFEITVAGHEVLAC